MRRDTDISIAIDRSLASHDDVLGSMSLKWV
jgi:hypothetical protein